MKPSSLIQSFKIGIKKNRKDAVCIKLPEKSSVSLITTKNKFAAAPVQLSKKHIKKCKPKYLLINSGNANACTGVIGLKNARKCCQRISKIFDCKEEEVLVFSTGIIGEQLPINKILNCIDRQIFKFNSSWSDAALAIMTTDKSKKVFERSFNLKNRKIKITGICKGAGMIEPNMATMLSFIEINVKINQKLLLKLLKNTADRSFNRISVDGDMSTNDSVVLIASGEVDKINFEKDKSAYRKLENNLFEVAQNLSKKIVSDGEGSTKSIFINIINAKNRTEAKIIATTLANSQLIKTAIYGSDPNWGRILAKLGSAYDISYDIKKIILKLNGYNLFNKGSPIRRKNFSLLKKSMKRKNIEIFLNLCSGKESYNLITSDLSKEYVHLNSAYTS